MVTESDILFAGNTSNDFDRSLAERLVLALGRDESIYFYITRLNDEVFGMECGE